jgi:hypothetical protein
VPRSRGAPLEELAVLPRLGGPRDAGEAGLDVGLLRGAGGGVVEIGLDPDVVGAGWEVGVWVEGCWVGAGAPGVDWDV